jgi:hypothetical protein
MKVFLIIFITLLTTSCVSGTYTEFYTSEGEAMGCDSYYSVGSVDWISNYIIANQRYDDCVRRAKRNGWTTNRQPKRKASEADFASAGDNLSEEERQRLEKEAERLRQEIRRLRQQRNAPQ